MTNSNIVMIQTERLEHHPDNPRKEIGDITELAASIGVDGILQNLTVVPQPKNKDKFYIVIGNRRYEAGCAAGLHEFPCVISDMDYTKQLETMLVENMNRSDLTPYEEAKGFEQLTLAGYSTEEIAEKTGFSKATIKRRINLCQYDKELVVNAFKNQATFEDFEKLNKLKDKKLRDKAAGQLGSKNFDWEFSCCMKEQRIAERKLIILEALKNANIEDSKNSEEQIWEMNRLFTIPICADSDDASDMMSELEALKNLGDGEYYYYFDYSGNCSIYELSKEEKQEEVVEPVVQKNKEEIEQLESLFEQMRKRHLDYIINYDRQANSAPGFALICFDTISELFKYKEINGTYCRGISDVESYMSERNKIIYSNFDSPMEVYAGRKPFSFWIDIVAALLIGGTNSNYYDYLYSTYNGIVYKGDDKNDCNHRYILRLKLFIKFLIDIGYEMSDEEKQLIDGTHRLYHLDDESED